jgi:hypothetical protein
LFPALSIKITIKNLKIIAPPIKLSAGGSLTGGAISGAIAGQYAGQ